jgi:hypothetical protein
MQHNRQHRRMDAWPSNYIMDWWLQYISTPHVTHWFWLDTVPFTRHGLYTHTRRQNDKQFTYYVVFWWVLDFFTSSTAPTAWYDFCLIQRLYYDLMSPATVKPTEVFLLKCQIFLSNFNQFGIFGQICHTSPQHQISPKGHRDIRAGMKKPIKVFCNYAKVPNNPSVLALQLHKRLVYLKSALSQHLDMAMCIPDVPQRE